MAVATVAGATEPDWKTALAKPISPGAIALLVPGYREVPVGDRLRQALRDPRPQVRATAARVINVGAVSGLADDLWAALQSEADADAATEEIRAVVALLGAGPNDLLIRFASDHAERADAIAAALARQGGKDTLKHLARLRPTLHEGGLWRFLFHATRGEPEELRSVASASLQDRDVALWKATLSVAREQGVDFDALLLSALHSPAAAIRSAAVHDLFRDVSEGASPAGAVRDALAEAPPEGAEAVDDAEAVAREIVSRMLARDARREAREDLARLGRIDFDSDTGRTLADDLSAAHVLRFLTPAERRAFSLRVLGSEEALESRLKEKGIPIPRPGKGEKKPGTPAPRSITVRTPQGLPPAMVSDLVRVSGCGGKAELGAIVVTYREDGRPRSVTPPATSLSPPCAAAMSALGMTALTPDAELAPAEPVTLLMFFEPDFVSCLAEEALPVAGAATERVVAIGPIREPRKIRHVNPVYPEGARNERVQGAVVLNATVAPSGCVRSLDVVQGVDPRLDVAALRSVAHWRYTPTLLRGKPVPVIMTITVNFRLN
jgi:TonB family protein